MIRMKDFEIRWEWNRGRLRGQENRGSYSVFAKGTGRKVKAGFTSKRSAETWLFKTIRVANEIRKEETAWTAKS